MFGKIHIALFSPIPNSEISQIVIFVFQIWFQNLLIDVHNHDFMNVFSFRIWFYFLLSLMNYWEYFKFEFKKVLTLLCNLRILKYATHKKRLQFTEMSNYCDITCSEKFTLCKNKEVNVHFLFSNAIYKTLYS